MEELINKLKEFKASEGDKEAEEMEETIKEAIEQLQEKDKIINEMTKVIIESSICDYFIKQNCKHYAGENRKTCDSCIIEYFTKKAREV